MHWMEEYQITEMAKQLTIMEWDAKGLFQQKR